MVSFPWRQLGGLIMGILPRFVVSPIFWLVVYLVYRQYLRLEQLEQGLFGVTSSSVGRKVAQSLTAGLVGGFAGSWLLTFVGVSLTGAGVMYVWPVAIALLLVNPRFMCFAYAGGLVASFSLVVGFPMVEIPQLLALVAVLHLVETILIWLTGHLEPTPVVVKSQGQLVGGFNLQKFWPIPVVVMMAVVMETPTGLGEIIKMPQWWPLVQPQWLPSQGELVYSMLLVTAALGYGDLALTCSPREKARSSARNLGFYSVSLLALAVGASRWSWLTGPAVLWAPLGHEIVIRVGNRGQLTGTPRFVAPSEGVMVLAAVPGSLAAALALEAGEVLEKVNDEVITDVDHLHQLLTAPTLPIEITIKKPTGRRRQLLVTKAFTQVGIISVPSGNTGPFVQVETGGLGKSLWKWLKLWWKDDMG